jgi:predicted ribosomally synthesized peptide with nif11-like leader
MSKEGATALYGRISSDEAFSAQLEAAETPDDKRRIVTEAGYDVGRDDLSTVRKLAGMSEISDEDLEKVAGGMGDITGGILTGVGVVACAVGAAL